MTIPAQVKRLSRGREATFRGVVGTLVHPSAPRNLVIEPDYEQIENTREMNSEFDEFAPIVGSQTANASVEFPVSDTLLADHGDVLETLFGEKVTADALVIDAGGTNSDTTVTHDGTGVPDDIIEMDCDDSNTYRRPVTWAEAVGTLRIKLPSGVSPTALRNASDTSGAAYRDKKDGTVHTYETRYDNGGLTGQVPVTLKGCAPMPYELGYDLGGLLTIKEAWQVAEHNVNAGAGISDPGDFTETYLSEVISFGLQSWGTPVALDAKNLKSVSGIKLGYTLLPIRASQAPTNADENPPSPITGYIRTASFRDIISLVFLDAAGWTAWNDARVARTNFLLWLELRPGTPNETAGDDSVCLLFPRVKVVKAMRTEVDEHTAVAVDLRVERETSQRRAYLSIFK